MADDRPASFETSLQRLEAIVRTLETDDVDLERAVNLYAEGKQLVAKCEEQLKDAQRKIEAYLRNDVRLAVLIDPMRRRVYVGREGDAEPADAGAIDVLDCAPVMPGFVLDVAAVMRES